jgi:hypothetical protein
VVSYAAPVQTEMVCRICSVEIDVADTAVCVIQFPNMGAHMVCLRDWAIILSSAYAWLNDDVDSDADTPKSRIQRAARLFLAGNGLEDLIEQPEV